MRARLAAAVVAAGVCALPAAAATATLTDPTGDLGSGGLDVTTVSLSGEPGGQVSILVTTPNPRLAAAHGRDQRLPRHRPEPSTGTVGIEYRLRAY